jgi:hypothetical protein
MGHMLIELPIIRSSLAGAPLAEVRASSPITTDELSNVTVSRYRRPGWFWLGYMCFGIAFWTGVGFGIHALIAVL